MSPTEQASPPRDAKTAIGARFANEFAIDPANLRADLLKLVLRVGAFIGVLVYLPSVYVAAARGFNGVILVDTLTVGTLVGLLVFDVFSLRVRAIIVCLIFYTVGLCMLVYVGPISQIFLFVFSIVAVLLLGQRAGMWAALLSAVSLLVVGGLGFAAPEMVAPNGGHDLTEWAVISLNFGLFNVLITLAVGTMVTAVNKALAKEIASRESLDRERNLLRTLFNTLPDFVFTKDTEARFTGCNGAALKLFGLDREDQVIGKSGFDFFPLEAATARHMDDLAVMAGETVVNHEERSVDLDGQPSWHQVFKAPLKNAAGETIGLLGISRNITDRKLAEAERSRLLTQLQLQIERMPLGYLLMDKNTLVTRWNPAAEAIFGFSESDVLGKNPMDVIVPPHARPTAASTVEKIQSGSMEAHVELEILTKKGAPITCEFHNTPLYDDDGLFTGFLSLAQNVTARKGLEGQLRQAQKMEAVGQLAGGVAHDFNNLLSVVLSHSDLALEDLKPGDPVRADVEEIRNAGTRAAALTRQLLMFSRQQVVEPKVLDLNEVLASVDKMVRRLIGEDIELTSVHGASLGHVRADRGSVEQVVVNLIVNARDAMPLGGKLTMETANATLDDEYAKAHVSVKPGPYVMLSVTDTGTGIDKATLARIFEPFFTTKGPGKGTGLGLSTVFGIAQQSGGTVWVYSEPGIGTTFKVYLPRVDEEKDEAVAPSAQTTLQGDETILLVEDELKVRDVARGILQRQGYTVLDAQSGEDALLLSARHIGPIHLLLSDVVMPKMSGPALAKLLAPGRPTTRVLFMSGYTDDAAVRHGVIEAEFSYLQKPITKESLSQKVRSVLDAARGLA
jgi:two-component system cell cycle sensor histidine kinase/response regulator CckA